MNDTDNLEERARIFLLDAVMSRQNISKVLESSDLRIKDFLIRMGYISCYGNHYDVSRLGRKYASGEISSNV
jgi:hypothetical protein